MTGPSGWPPYSIKRMYMAAFLQIIIGGLTGLDGSGFSGLPLTGAMARTFGAATGASVPRVSGSGTNFSHLCGRRNHRAIEIIPVAAICGVNPVDLARKNLLPVAAGFLAAFLAACF